MNTIVLFYSLTGRTHKEAKRIANELGAERLEVTERRNRSAFGALFSGCIEAKRRTASHIDPIAVRLSDYDEVILMAPVWGGYPAPAFNSMVKELSEGVAVRIILTSKKGRIKDEEKLVEFVESTGAKVKNITVLKVGKK